MSKAKIAIANLFTGVTFAVFAVVLAIAASSIRTGAVEATSSFNYDSCLNGYTINGETINGNGVLSIKNACSYCQSRNGGPYGVLWFNDSATSAQGNTIRIDSWDEETKSVWLWGGVYSCSQPSGVDNWANYVWFGLPNEMKGNGTTIDKMVNAASFFDLSQSYYGDSVYRAVYRGKVSGSKYSWSDFSAQPTTSKPNSYKLPNVAVFYPNKFREEAMKVGGCSDFVEGGVTKLKCTMKISVNRCYNDSLGKYYNSTNVGGSSVCYGDPSEIVLIAPPYTEGGFSSKSRVESDSGSSESPSWDQDAPTLEVEADSSGNATVTFTHKLNYKSASPSGNYNDAYTNWTISIDDNSGGPWTGTYSTYGGADAESNWLPGYATVSTTINLGNADEKTVCSTISYTTKNLQWDNGDPRSMVPSNDTGSTKACAKIVRSETEEIGSIEFWSRSHVESIRDSLAPDVVYHKASTYDNFSNTTKIDGDEVTLRLSTDYTSAHATFRHDLGFDITLNDGITFGPNDKIEFDEMCTNWKIESAETSGNGANGEYCASTQPSDHETDVHVTTNHTVNIGSAEGAEATAAEKITFEKKKVPILRSEIKTNACGTDPETYTCSYEPKRWKYYAEDGTGSGAGSSAARIEYVRPTEPTGNGPSSSGAGSTDGSPMYAGESSEMVWQADAEPSTTRRVEQYQAIAFLVPVNWTTSNAKTTGTYQNTNTRLFNTPSRDRNRNDPCTFWRTQYGWQLREAAGGCAQVSSVSRTFSGGTIDAGEASVNGSESMAVPDWVGDKYCNSFGYQWGYYYGIKNTKIDSGAWNWQFDNQTYWVHYDAACRTIAKKPSVAFWNGGLFAGAGNVSTSTSTRRQNPFVGVLASSMPTTQYGSWAEYLANVAGSVGGNSLLGMIPGLGGVSGLFSSGAAYAWNGSSTSNALSNSPLTIQNVNSSILGYSGVSPNSAMIDRLEAYFKKAATTTDQNTISEMKNISNSLIYYVDGNVEITGNIELSSTVKNSIYQLPQVVIFATGDINISENVTQIDAWLISKQKVDTCYNKFIVGLTQARVNGNPVYSNNNCQEKLNINGPVFAQTITTKRSFGSDGTSNSDTDSINTANPRAVPAEVFNLSAESYLWAYAQAGRYSSSYTEAYSRELPPRY